VDLGALRELVRDVNFATHGVPATVTPPGAPAVTTRVIWLTPLSVQSPVGASFTRTEAQRIVAIPRDDVPEVPRGTLLAVTEPFQSAPVAWKVDGIDEVRADHYRAVVIPA
jgi:hypothetical protein